MQTEVVPGAWDCRGRPIFEPRKRHGFLPTFPLGAYMTHPLTVECATIEEVREFLCGCRYLSDMEQFGQPDYWMFPEEFERIRQGDCEDFALWTWRQLLRLGYEARFVVGRAGAFGAGHAWAVYFQEDRCFVVEPIAAIIGNRLPRLRGLFYWPRVSVGWDGDKLHYYEHEEIRYHPGVRQTSALFAEWLLFQFVTAPKIAVYFGRALFHFGLIAPKIAIRALRRRPVAARMSSHKSSWKLSRWNGKRWTRRRK